ncbi:hypothetical protein SAMN04487895_11243 [Paenibacillus sophorae]|uniref:Uncharacterized protein n=1 Tax=Paenibacillus sophorae TaxID=1333845 RepID=A0A1H8SQL0_9BACL|nr:hypothetical protein [Paenibacillus sophorae]QWU15507.1 hypothetical protein KP014_27250 [Paenibacillus sophorae]SEO80463.1 hypothetical protein SAMN04487895_11243 [Paenibacillus sophorae]
MPHSNKKRAPGKILFRTLAGVVLFLLLAGVAAAWYAAPVNKLDMSYDQVDLEPKLLQMAKDRSPVLTLTEDELNNLCKKGLNDYLSEHPSSLVRITGARFRQSGDRLTADINGQAGPVPFGAEVGMIMEVSPDSGGTIRLRHDYTSIRNRKVPKGILSIPPISVRLRDHMPFMVEVHKIELLESGVRVSFAVDWGDLLRLLMKLK